MSTLARGRLSPSSLLLALATAACGPEGPPTGPSAAPTAATASAVTWVPRDLGTLGGPASHAYAINSAGVIVGSSNIPGATRPHAFMWRNGVMTDLGTLGGTTSGANGINRSGVIVGQSTTASGARHAFRWKDGVFKDLGALDRQYSFASAINTRGQIVGTLGPHFDAQGEELDFSSAFLYAQEVMRIIGVGAGRVSVIPRAISPEGLVVGQGFDTGDEAGEERAWWWENGASGRLPPLDPSIMLDNHAGAYGVNRAGTVVGFSKTASGWSHAVLWRRQ